MVALILNYVMLKYNMWVSSTEYDNLLRRVKRLENDVSRLENKSKLDKKTVILMDKFNLSRSKARELVLSLNPELMIGPPM